MAAPRVSKEKFKRDLPALRDELLSLQLKLHTSKACAVAIIIIGTPAAGRSETVNEILEWLDPKHITVHALGPSDRDDRQWPPMWRYWQKLPARGRMSLEPSSAGGPLPHIDVAAARGPGGAQA